jgi:ribonuclease Y
MAKYAIYVEQSKAKAKAIEHEAQLLLENAKVQIQSRELELKRKLEEEFAQTRARQDAKAQQLHIKEEQLEEDRRQIARIKKEVQRLQKEGEQQQERYKQRFVEASKAIEQAAGMTAQEAKDLLLKQIEESARLDAANVIRKAEVEAKSEARRRANYIIAQATTRYAGEFTSERLINTIHIDNDEYKGRIIGKEGRNIKALESALGVDIIVDDTPGAIVVSSFNLYRRAIATRTIELLIEDGRIQPTRIEEIHAAVKEQFEESLLEEGREIVIDLGIGDMHPELLKLIGRLKYRASYGQNALAHSLEVANLSGIIAAELDGNEKLAKRAGILHDIGKALTHESEGSHVDLGAEICRRYKEGPVVINAIYAHHGHEEPTTIESAAVCTADTLSAARPGARREVLESFLKRVQEIENIATGKRGVFQAYAISAGRELRVIVNATEVDDREIIMLSKDIAKEIEQKVQYPGEIKVNVIRETRAVEMAR